MSDRPSHWLEPITEGNRKPHACNICEANGAIPVTIGLESYIAVGFGYAGVTKDGGEVYQEPTHDDATDDDYWTVGRAEQEAEKQPDADWRIHIEGPLSGRTYQRQGPANWVLVDQNEGFA